MYQVTNTEGRTFNVRVVRQGEGYGLNDARVHDKPDPLVVFYDATRTRRSPRGQQVACYYLYTLLEDHDRSIGLALDGGVPAWWLDACSLREALAYAAGVLAGGRAVAPRPMPRGHSGHRAGTLPPRGENMHEQNPQPETLQAALRDHGVTMVATEIPQRTDGQSAWSRDASHWHVTLTRNGRSEAWEYSRGSAHRRKPRPHERIGQAIPPDASDVVSCLVSDSYSGDQTFEDFASDTGLDTDSRRAHRTWLACVDTRIRLRNLLEDAFDAIATASEDY